MARTCFHVLLAVLLGLFGCSKSSPPVPANQVDSPAEAALALDSPMSRFPTTISDWARGAMLFDGLGDTHRAITTSSAEAQAYFDQGIRLIWAFNHDEATRSFAKAAELDSNCASCFWGVALTVGPNYNLPFLSAERAKIAFQALRLARENASRTAPVEQALIAALSKRYPNDRPLDSQSVIPILSTYAEAMKSVAERFPTDLDVQTWYAESLMNLHAWKLWGADGTPAPGTEQIVAILQAVLARDPRHIGANHYLVHAVEAGPHPEIGLSAAARLEDLAPAAGHLVHMPAHIYQRLGRYEYAAQANRNGAQDDAAYTTRTRPLDYYPVMYTAHNYQFLVYSAAMEGRKAETVAAADNSRKVASDEMLLEMPGTDWYVAESYVGRVRFGMWDELLALPRPNPELVGLTGGFLFGRGVALAATGHVDEARVILGDLQKLAASVPADAIAGQNAVKDVLAIAIPILQGRIAGAEHRSSEAVSLLRQAVAAEDRLAYDEPKDWLFPARHLLGAELLRAGKAAEAERVYREDLRQNPANGWSLFGLSAALKAQGKTAESIRVRRQFADAWKHSDITLAASAF
jgi:tetratricopeptide (TPR) repeat protein